MRSIPRGASTFAFRLLGGSRGLWTFILGTTLLVDSGLVASPVLNLTPQKSAGVYATNEPIVWSAALSTVRAAKVAQASYILKVGGGRTLAQGTTDLLLGNSQIIATLDHPGTILAELTLSNSASQVAQALSGVAIAPHEISPSAPCPADFDEFWLSKLHELSSVPADARLRAEASGKRGVDYWKVTMDNIRGTHIQGQLARPKKGGKFPALLIVQWAGIYPLNKIWVTGPAAEGWLVMDISAHDLPIDRSQSFYDSLSTGALTNYTTIGDDDREHSYFLRMFLADYRMVDYLASRPDWDGHTLVVSGTSQGGLQSFVAAGLNPKVTALLALVPAGCDNTGDLVGRRPGWPYWVASAGEHDPEKVRATSRYFDGVNFAARVRCPALIGLGLIDTTSPPSGVFAAINQIKGPKEVVVMRDADHHGNNHTHAPYEKQRATWLEALREGREVPIQSELQSFNEN